MNNKGQMIGFGFIMGIVMLVVSVLLITAFWPTIQDSFNDLRDQDELNCKSDYSCDNGNNTICYNSSIESQTTTCAMLSIGPPLILIMLIIGAIALIISPGSPSPQPYQGY